MKVILYMAATLNGLIAKMDDDTSWISPTEWQSYSAAVRGAGNVVMGHRTYDIITKQPEFAEFKDVQVVIVSSKEFQTLAPNHRIAHSPQEALEFLKDFPRVMVAGGGHLNGAFMAEKLIDEIILDIEPKLLGRGIALFESADFEANLELLETKSLSPSELQLHYKVVR